MSGAPEGVTGAVAAVDAAVVVCDLGRRFGPVVALDGVSLTVPAGEVVAVIGPNGAGKSTFLRVLAGLVRPDVGSARVAGADVVDAPDIARQRVGYAGHQVLLYPDLTADENLRFWARMHGCALSDDALGAVVAAAGLHRRRHDRVRTFSRGTAQRLDIARALLHDPAVLLLDEPHTGLDPDAADALDASLAALACSGRTVVLATHDLARARRGAGSIAVLQRGRLVWAGPAAAVPAEDVAGWYHAVTTDGSIRTTGVRLGRTRRDGPTATVGGGPRGAPRWGMAIAGGADDGSGWPRGAAPTDGLSGDRDPAVSHAARFADIVRALVWKDIRIEARAREALPPVVVFALLVVVIFQFALPPEAPVRSAVAPGALWIALLFGASLGLGRLAGTEADSGGVTGLRLCPVDRGALFVGKWFTACVFTALVTGVLLPALVVLLGLSVGPGRLLALGGVVVFALAGWVATGVVMAALAASTRAREVLLPVLLFPVVLPLVVAAVQATAAVLGGGGVASVTTPLLLVVAYDVVFWVLGFLLYGHVLEE
jgi:heme exporter protein A